MSVVPTWLIGRFVTAISVIPQTVGSDGTLTAGTSHSMTGRLDEITWTGENTTESIMGFDTRQDNKVITESGVTLELTEILDQQAATNTNVLSAVYAASDYVLVTFTRGGKAFTGFFTVGTYNESLVRGKSVGKLSLLPCGLAPTLV